MLFAFHPLAFESFSIGPSKDSESLHKAVNPLTDVSSSVNPEVLSDSMDLVI